MPSAVFILSIFDFKLQFVGQFNELKKKKHKRLTAGSLYLIIRKSTVFAAKTHHDHVSEKW